MLNVLQSTSKKSNIFFRGTANLNTSLAPSNDPRNSPPKNTPAAAAESIHLDVRENIYFIKIP